MADIADPGIVLALLRQILIIQLFSVDFAFFMTPLRLNVLLSPHKNKTSTPFSDDATDIE
jgi:hypothetical protein